MGKVSYQSIRWVEAYPDVTAVTAISQSLDLPLSLAKVLVNRGFTEPVSASNFLNPQLRDLSNPFDLPNMEEAVERILHAIKQGERIVIYSDYDVDGMTSSTLFVRVLSFIGADIGSFVPHRMAEGYGLSRRGLERCVRECNPKLLIAVDCGTNSVDEIVKLRNLGIDTIVCDHHKIKSELPKGVAFVNPKLTRENETWSDLASVGVVFKVVHALQKRGRKLGLDWAQELDLREHLDLVAVGTIADVVPLLGENRTLSRAGLQQLATTNKIGLRALKEVAGVPANVTPYHVGFRIGPRINAAGRLRNAADALELLLTSQTNRAKELACQLNDCNAERQRIEESVLEAARQMVEDEMDVSQQRTIVLAGEGWHVGVIGIVAARIAKEYYRPAIVIGLENGIGKGSCRSIPGFSIIDAMAVCTSLLEQFGGHTMAAGITIREENVEALRQKFEQHANEVLSENELHPHLNIDAEIQLTEINECFIKDLACFEPCGNNNPTPVFIAKNVRVCGVPRVVGKKHLKFKVSDGSSTHEAIWFEASERVVPLGEIDVVFIPELNEFRGIKTTQLRVRDIRVSQHESDSMGNNFYE